MSSSVTRVFEMQAVFTHILLKCTLALDAHVEGYDQVLGLPGSVIISLMGTCKSFADLIRTLLTRRSKPDCLTVLLRYENINPDGTEDFYDPLENTDAYLKFAAETIVYMEFNFQNMSRARLMFSQFWCKRVQSDLFSHLNVRSLAFIGDNFSFDAAAPCGCFSIMHGVIFEQLQSFLSSVISKVKYLRFENILLQCTCPKGSRMDLFNNFQFRDPLYRLELHLKGSSPRKQIESYNFRMRELWIVAYGKHMEPKDLIQMSCPDLQSVVLFRPRKVPDFRIHIRELTLVDPDDQANDDDRWVTQLRKVNRAVKDNLPRTFRINIIRSNEYFLNAYMMKQFIEKAEAEVGAERFFLKFDVFEYDCMMKACEDGAMRVDVSEEVADSGDVQVLS